MPAFAVKHIVDTQGPLSRIMRQVRKSPHSYTSNEPEASMAANGGDVYVIEVRVEKAVRSFWLGYMYRAYEKYPPAGGGLWREKFKFKNAARPTRRAEGAYFEVPVEITDAETTDWLRGKTAGMAEMPETVAAALDALLDDPAHGAKGYD